ncbi:MAG: hypothetical protein HY909_16880 [Deltaproteobacteria bacterium]|nr:hypothetical protein [Deltaproteobacteria bacterium]
MRRSGIVGWGLLLVVFQACAQRPPAPPSDTGAADSLEATADAPDAVDTPEEPRSDAPTQDAERPGMDASDAPVPVDVPPEDTGVDDGPSGSDAEDTGPVSLTGYIRFLNLAPGTGTVRFLATSQPGFVSSYIEAVVREGESSGYIPTLPVSYFIDVRGAPGATPVVVTDGGLGDGGALLDGGPGGPMPDVLIPDVDEFADAGPRLADRITGDVYFRSGCTVVFAGRPDGDPMRLNNRRLWRVTDVPMRTADTANGLVRLISVIPEDLPVDVSEGGTDVALNLYFFEPTGFRRVRAGARSFTVRASEGGRVLATDLRGTVTASEAHTLYVWGTGGMDAGASLRAVLTNDNPPGR